MFIGREVSVLPCVCGVTRWNVLYILPRPVSRMELGVFWLFLLWSSLNRTEWEISLRGMSNQPHGG